MSEPCLLNKRAQRGTGAAAVDGVCMISKSSVRWQPNDPSKAQAALVDISAITSERPQPAMASLGLPPLLPAACRCRCRWHAALLLLASPASYCGCCDGFLSSTTCR